MIHKSVIPLGLMILFGSLPLITRAQTAQTVTWTLQNVTWTAASSNTPPTRPPLTGSFTIDSATGDVTGWDITGLIHYEPAAPGSTADRGVEPPGTPGLPYYDFTIQFPGTTQGCDLLLVLPNPLSASGGTVHLYTAATLYGSHEFCTTSGGYWYIAGELTTRPLKCDASAGITPEVQGVPRGGTPPPWQSDQYNNSKFTIGQKGCALTSLSMALEGTGVTVNPEQLNLLLDAFAGYQPDTTKAGLPTANVIWDKAVDIVRQNVPGASKKKWNSLGGFKTGAAAAAALDTQLCVNVRPVIVGVNVKNGKPSHYVLATGETTDGDFAILDPFYGHTLLSQFAGPFQTRGVITDPVDFSYIEISSGSEVALTLVDPSNNVTGLVSLAGAITQNIPQSAYFVDGADTINADGSTTEDPTSFHDINVKSPASGRYLLVVEGLTSGTYNVNINGASAGGIDKQVLTLIGTARAGVTTSYLIDYSSTNAVPTTSKLILGDLNGDGLVNCSDLDLIKASFGKRVGEPGFDPRADLNGDGVVNVLDLAAEAKLMPAETVCR